MSIRIATSVDAKAIAVLHANSWRYAYRGVLSDDFLNGPVFDDRLALWTERFAQPCPNQCVLVSGSRDVITGFVGICVASETVPGSQIESLHVNQILTRTGLGRELMLAAAAWLQAAAPCASVHVDVVSSNRRARAFYEHFTTADVVDKSTWAPPDGGSIALVRYQWMSPAELLPDTN